MPVFMQDGYLNPNRSRVLFNNFATISNTTFGSQAAGFPGVNVLDPATYNSWRANSVGGAVMTINTPNNRTYSGVGIAAHNMASVGSRVVVQYSGNGTDWVNILIVTPLTNEDIFIMFNPISTSWFRLNFQIAVPDIGVVIAGQNLAFPSTPIDSYTPAQHSKQYTKQFNRSIKGQFLGNRVMGSGGMMDIQFPHVTRDWVDGPLLNFEDHYNRGGTFFYAGWPGGKPQDMAYGWPGSEDSIIDVEYVIADKLATVSFDMQFYNPT